MTAPGAALALRCRFVVGLTTELRSCRVLVVEDDGELFRPIALQLRGLGCHVRCVGDGIAALEEALSQRFDLVILDLTPPRLDGLELCARLRRREPGMPILILASGSGAGDPVAGLEAGADDYLAWPFDPRELQARVGAILRRARVVPTRAREAPKPFRVGSLRIDPGRRQVMLGGRELCLTVKEFDLLAHLARHPGRVYTREQLLDLVWGHGHESAPHTVSSHVNRLRAKLESAPPHPRLIQTVWGLGYRFAEP